MERKPQRRIDPRIYQVTVLSALLLYGIGFLSFDLSFSRMAAIVGTALLTQWICTRISRLPGFDPRSPMTSALSLCLLLRTDQTALAVLAAILTIASKFILRWNGKHIFNPTNFGIMVMISMTHGVWVSPGQWGSTAFFGFFMASLGGFVIYRSSRSDITYAFMAFYLAILFSRTFWLGEPVWIPLHRLQNGGFLLFSFFMISDPKTTPDSRIGRILFAFLIAVGAGFVHFYLYRPNGLLWSLVFSSMTTPLIDRLFPGGKYTWPGFTENKQLSTHNMRRAT
ncbi:MAG: RnfABCDGE type electron transport complex subunit D [Nitrospiria bacterium]